MLTANVLNSDATLNDFEEIGSVQFIPGEQITLVLQLINPQLNLRFVPLAGSIITLILNNADGTVLNPAMTMMTDDRSIISGVITSTQSANLIGGNIQFKVDNGGTGSDIILGWCQNGLQQITPNN